MTTRLIGAAALGGLAVGGVTSIGQQVLPVEIGSLANSAGPWSLAAFALCLLNRSPRRGALLGAAALLAMVGGYAAASELRGFVAGSRLILFWGLAAIIVGPLLGVGAAWVRGSEPVRAAFAAGVIGGILIGEGIYGVTLIAGTTSAAYWIGQAAVGCSLVLVVIFTRAIGWAATAAGVASAAVVAAAFWLTFAADPIAILA